MSGAGDLDGGGSGGEGVLGGPGNVLFMGGGEGGDWIFGMKSANRFLARPKGNCGRPNAESSGGMVGLAYGAPRSTDLELSSESSPDGALERAAAGESPLKMAPVFWVADPRGSP